MNSSIVIIPTYNEKENIKFIIEAVFDLSVRFDILIVDDNSPDETAKTIKQLQSKYNSTTDKRLRLIEREAKLGLGTAYITGFKYVLSIGYTYILEMDADFSHNPKDLIKLHEACDREGADMSIGSRYVTGVNVVNWSIKRVLLSYYASAYVRLVTRMPIRDTTAGFVCYHRSVLETIPLDKVKLIGYAFQIEMKFLAWKYGFRIIEVPIIFTDRLRGVSKLSSSIFKEAFFGILALVVKSWFKKFRRQKAIASNQNP